MTERIGVADVKRQFADVLGRVHYRGERFIIERNGTPLAALVPLSDLDDDGADDLGAIALVGAFADASEYADAVDDAVAARSDQASRPAPTLS